MCAEPSSPCAVHLHVYVAKMYLYLPACSRLLRALVPAQEHLNEHQQAVEAAQRAIDLGASAKVLGGIILINIFLKCRLFSPRQRLLSC